MNSKTTFKRIAQLLFVLVSVILLFTNIDLGQTSSSVANQQYIEGKVISESIEPDNTQTLEISLQDGNTVFVTNNYGAYANEKSYSTGNKVVLSQYQDQYFIVDYVRRPSLALLFGIFIGLILIVNRKKGLLSLISMGFSFLVLFKLVIPLLFIGIDPVLSAILGSLLMTPAIFYLSHGLSRKTSIAMLGTLITLIITGLLATTFTELSQLSGLATEEAGFLKTGIGENINFKGLLLAGMIISILGVLDDVTITQTSVVEQLKASKKDIQFIELYTRSMAVGRDHIASVINTLILVYTGASLPLLLLFMDSSESFEQLFNLEFMAEEIVRTLVGSIGLILAVPITTLLASHIYNKTKHAKIAGGHKH